MNEKNFIGQLDVRISIVERQRVESSTGGEQYTEVTFKNCWAKVQDVSGAEQEDGKVYALNVRRYILVYDPIMETKQINDLYIVDHLGAMYNIHAFQILGRKDWIELKCSKRE